MEKRSSRQKSKKLSWFFVLSFLLIGIILGLSILWLQKASFDEKLSRERKRYDQKLSRERKRYEDELEKTKRTIEKLKKKIAKLESQVEEKTESDQTTSKTSEKASSSTSSSPPNILSRSVEPETVGPGQEMTLHVELTGEAEKVEMEIVGEGFKKTYLLKKVSTLGRKEIWEKKISAPSSPGLYRYYAYAYRGTTQVSMPGVSAWSFLVE